MFRVRANVAYVTRAMTEFGVQTLRKKRWAVAHVNEPFGIDCKERLVAELARAGIEPVAVQGFSASSHNLDPVVHPIRAGKPDIVAACVSSAGAAGRLASQLRSAGVEATLLGSSSLSSAATREAANEALHGAYAAPGYAEASSPAARRFARAYAERWHSNDDLRYGAWAYDAIRLLAAAMKKAGTTRPEPVRAELLKIRGHAGAMGTFQFEPNGDGLHEVNIVRIDKGQEVFVKTLRYGPRR